MKQPKYRDVTSGKITEEEFKMQVALATGKTPKRKKKVEEVEVEEVNEIPSNNNNENVKKTTTALRRNMTDEEFRLAQRERALKSVAAKQKKTPLSKLIDMRFSDKKRKEVVDAYIGYLTDDTIRISDRIKILELILKVTGEIEHSKAFVEVNDAENKIKLEIT
ncbi:MAG: hypothetical protein II304_07205 [Bacteroidales bacterium]|nr:hypothetical protein [Bacteroidales bacterium]